MAFQSTTGLGTPTQIAVTGNDPNKPNKVKLNVASANGPTTFQLEPIIQDAGGNALATGTPLVLTAAAASGGALVLTAAAAAVNGATAYTGTITGGAANALIGKEYVVAGFTNAANNGTFVATASTATVLTLSNASGAAETHAGTATDQAAVAVYTGTITGGGSSALAGFDFVIAGFAGANNNGTFTATASSATTLTLGNPNATAETHAGTATQEETTPLTYVVYGASTNSAGTSNPTGSKVAIATVSATGLITAVAPGGVEVEVSYPTFNNTQGNVVSSGNIMNGLPLSKIFQAINVEVRP